MPLIEGAFRRAQEKALAARRVDGMDDTYDRALIEAYLGDAEVLDEAREAVDPLSEDNRNTARAVLQAIGAEVSP